METFTEIVAREKEERGWSYRQFARAANVSHTYIRDIVINKVVPADDVVLALARALGLDEEKMILLARREKSAHQDVVRVYESIDQRLHEALEDQSPILRVAEGYPGEEASERYRPAKRLVWVPVFDAQAGQPASWTDGGYPVGFSSDYEYLPSNHVDENSFCVRVHGDSMEPGLKEGDLVLIKPSEPLVNGKLCFASFPGEDGDRMVKRYYRYGDTIVLRSDNEAYGEITLSQENSRGVRIFRVTRSIRQE
ncbi:MAG: S24 family peptidase [Thermodesulfobacteriota bacterium]